MSAKAIVAGFFVLLPMLAFSAVPSFSEPSAAQCAVRAVVKGKVQHVAFRESALKAAIRYRVKGSAKNLNNGTVELLLYGSPHNVEAMLKVIENNLANPYGHVTGLSVSSIVKKPQINTFTVYGWTSGWYCVKGAHDLVWDYAKQKHTAMSDTQINKAVYKLISPWVRCRQGT